VQNERQREFWKRQTQKIERGGDEGEVNKRKDEKGTNDKIYFSIEKGAIK